MRQSRWEISLNKNNFNDFYLDGDLTSLALSKGHIELKLIKCAITANNVTYALLGNSFGPWQKETGYWDFFSRNKPQGILPVWGLAEVVESHNDFIETGRQLYGFFPLASHCRLSPGKINSRGFVEDSKSRSDLPSVYNHYSYTDATSAFDKKDENYWPVFRPLLVTAFMIHDQLDEHHYYEASSIVFASASSKTAFATAACISRNKSRPKLIGLTSYKNKDFVVASEAYDEVYTYDEVESLPTQHASIFIDMAGNREITSKVHTRLEGQLNYSVIVGKSHWNSQLPSRDMPGPDLDAFFAPARVSQRLKEWGREEYGKRLDHAWQAILQSTKNVFSIEESEDVVASLTAAFEGKFDPQKAVLLTNI